MSFREPVDSGGKSSRRIFELDGGFRMTWGGLRLVTRPPLVCVGENRAGALPYVFIFPSVPVVVAEA